MATSARSLVVAAGILLTTLGIGALMGWMGLLRSQGGFAPGESEAAYKSLNLMRISALEIKNYRNLDGLTIKFHPKMNFIIGENNLGKSNLLDLLNILFNRNNFSESDFLKRDEQIHITFSLGLSDIEQGFFNDLFDPNDREKINIVAIQESPDDVIKFQRQESETVISSNRVRCVNYINYDSLRNPSSELSFSKNRGVGKFLNHIIVKYLQAGSLQDSDFVIIEKIKDLILNAVELSKQC
ncbi:MAG: AAA family ATPase [Planktothrix rubescens PR222]